MLVRLVQIVEVLIQFNVIHVLLLHPLPLNLPNLLNQFLQILRLADVRVILPKPASLDELPLPDLQQPPEGLLIHLALPELGDNGGFQALRALLR